MWEGRTQRLLCFFQSQEAVLFRLSSLCSEGSKGAPGLPQSQQWKSSVFMFPVFLTGENGSGLQAVGHSQCPELLRFPQAVCRGMGEEGRQRERPWLLQFCLLPRGRCAAAHIHPRSSSNPVSRLSDTHPRGRMASAFSKLLTGRNASLLLATVGTSALTTGYLLNRQNVCAEAREHHRLFPPR